MISVDLFANLDCLDQNLSLEGFVGRLRMMDWVVLFALIWRTFAVIGLLVAVAEADWRGLVAVVVAVVVVVEVEGA